MDRCQEKAIHRKIIKNQYGLMRSELNFSKNKIQKLERNQIALIKDMYDNPLNEYELALQEFVITGFNRTKFPSMIYDVSISKREGIGYHKKLFNSRTKTLIKPSNPYSSSSVEKWLYSQFVSFSKSKG